ncbi:uncharacterized protein [Temnothorax longispinosus]|uniref:uncharacterized protein n=1 Tax=Temnothorax longispinosus TaxID=300112 RepID=UPI003A995E2E
MPEKKNQMEDLIQGQRDLHGRISRVVENLRKLGQANITAGAVQSRLASLESCWNKFEEQDKTLRTVHREAVSGTSYLKEDFFSLVEEVYLNQKGTLLDCSTRLSRTPQAESRADPSASRTTLPRIQLPEFTGRYEDWPAFRDLFQSLIGKDSSLSEVERLHYLKVSLKEDAEALIKNLPTTAENYRRAWKILCEQFENKRLLVRSCLTKFTALQKMKSETATELRKVLNGASTTAGALESIGRPISSSEDLFVFFVVERLDARTRREWENSISESPNPPTYEALKRFLDRRLQTLEAIQPGRSETPANKSTETGNKASRSHHVQKREPGFSRCGICKKEHALMLCDVYKGKPARERKQYVDSNSLCENCLGRHKVNDCPSKRLCSVCAEKHHTSLHDAFRKTPTEPEAAKTESVTTAHVARNSPRTQPSVLLATARVQILDRYGRSIDARVLIDQGSEATIITENLAQRLKLPRRQTSVAVFGVGGDQTGVARGSVVLKISPRSGGESVTSHAIILPRLTEYSSVSDAPFDEWPHIQGLELADPDLTSTDPIDVLLGADVYSSIVLEGLRKGTRLQPVAQKTIFGWILLGQFKPVEEDQRVSSHQCLLGESLSTLVRKFWEQEELPISPTPLTLEEQECQEWFTRTHQRTPDGRYVVRLPVRSTLPDLSETRTAAIHSLLRTERRFLRDTEFRELYTDFISTYEDLNHMSRITTSSHLPARVCYLPHHGVFRAASTSTRLRVVFNGSWTVSSGTSLNEHLHVGPNLLPALADRILRWRWHTYAMAADIEKMYRQILVHKEDRDLQRIVWRKDPDGEILDLRLNTVTYGQACAPFLALSSLRQLARDEQARFPKGVSVVLEDSYMDEFYFGADTKAEALEKQKQLGGLCKAGGFPLKKWTANSTELLENIPEDDRLPRQSRACTDERITHSALGLLWDPLGDCFSFAVKPPAEGAVTKRSILSQTAQLFDPLGWLTPTIVLAKIFIQSAWLLGLDWDEPLPENEAARWVKFKAELPVLSNIRVPRALAKGTTNYLRTVHGFADASERAYAAVLYLRAEGEDGEIKVTLITAKSKVAPLKQVTLARLELSAAELLARLARHSVDVLRLQDLPLHLWTDSKVTLGWIQGHPSRWKTYVANRVAEIQRLVPEAQWKHLPGRCNPADCASRGLFPSELVNHELWWHGPSLLHEGANSAAVEQIEAPDECQTEQRAHTLTTSTGEPPEEHPLLSQYSTLHKLLRVTAWCRRWLPREHQSNGTGRRDPGEAHRRPLSATEIDDAEKLWIRHVQAIHYKRELSLIAVDSKVDCKGSLTNLSPLLDKEGMLRVGGRLRHATLSFDEKHPIILPPQSALTKLIIEACHRRALHGGAQLTLGIVRQRYWIPRGRNLTKQCIRRCITCVRWRAALAEQKMADLPRPRVTPARPFQYTGVDYAGPILLRTAPGRGHKATKGFLVVFVCLSTRAVHLDVASDYSSQAFIAAFKRFVSRRGMCTELFSDCGTNFVGADAELRKLFSASTKEGRSIAEEMANNRVRWRFNPPGAPHFGGLWEAVVKSAKHHLRRVLGDATLTYEEMTTLLTQIEACLNSRPLSPLTDDPEDCAALTPGHLLVGTALTAVPEPSLLDVPAGRLSRWQLLQQMRDQFWSRVSDRIP